MLLGAGMLKYHSLLGREFVHMTNFMGERLWPRVRRLTFYAFSNIHWALAVCTICVEKGTDDRKASFHDPGSYFLV